MFLIGNIKYFVIENEMTGRGEKVVKKKISYARIFCNVKLKKKILYTF